MIKTKFVFAVSLVAMLAVSSAWANAPGTGESVGVAHEVYGDPLEEGATGIAGVSYVNRFVNKVGASYEKLSNKYMTTTTGIEITNDNKDTYYPSIGKV